MDKLDEAIDFRLLNDFQRDFPLCSAPFAELASRLGVAEGVVLRALEGLRRQGKIARVGAIFAPKRIGVSTLAAMAVPADQLAAIAEVVNRFPEVNHNYEREHRYNLWFVATAGSEGRLQAALGAIEQVAGWPVLKLPLLEEYHIDLGFALDGQGERPGSVRVRSQTFTAPTPLDEFERRLVMALQEGLPLFIRPFSVLASRVGCDESEVLERIRRWCAEGIWDLAAFLQKMPLMAKADYEQLVAASDGHSHGGLTEHDHAGGHDDHHAEPAQPQPVAKSKKSHSHDHGSHKH